jgi:hypothetical protein
MRTEALVYLAVSGLVLGVVLLVRARVGVVRVVACGAALGLAALVPLVANEALERHVVGGTVRAARAAGTVSVAGDAASSRVEEAAVTTFGLEGDARGILLGAGFVILLAVASLHRDRGLAVVAAAGAGALVLVRIAADGLGFVPGLAPAWAFAVPGLLRTFGRDECDRSHSSRPDAPTVLAGIAVGAVPLVVLFQFRGGAGPQWAGRYLLTTGFLLAVLGLAAAAEGRLARPIAGAVAILAVGVTAFGVTWYAVRPHDVARTIATLERRPEPVIVSNVYHLAREGAVADAAGDKRWLTIGGSPEATPAAADAVLVASGTGRFAFVDFASTRPPAPDRVPHFVPEGRRDLRLFAGVTLRVTSYRRSP